MNVKLKQLQNKFRISFESVDPEEDETILNSKTEDRDNNPALEDSFYRLSIGFMKEQKKYWHLSADTGVKVESRPNPFVKTKGRRSFYFNDFEFKLVNRAFLEDIDGFSNYSDMNLYTKLSRDFSFSYSNKFVWQNNINELSTSHGPSIHQVIDDKQSVSYNIRTRFLNKPSYAITGHEVFSTYRRDLYKRWLFLGLTPGISFFAEDDYEKLAFIKLKLQAIFGDF
mgnify:FL=1